MTIQSISEEVRRIQKKYGESDPFRLAQAMKIIVVLKPMGRYKGCCKGFYVQHRRIKHITINSDLPEVIQRVILAHEIARIKCIKRRPVFLSGSQSSLCTSRITGL